MNHKRYRVGAYIYLCICGEQVPIPQWAEHCELPADQVELINRLRNAFENELINPDQDYDLWRLSMGDAQILAEKALGILK